MTRAGCMQVARRNPNEIVSRDYGYHILYPYDYLYVFPLLLMKLLV